jgi:hypothetical protein
MGETMAHGAVKRGASSLSTLGTYTACEYLEFVYLAVTLFNAPSDLRYYFDYQTYRQNNASNPRQSLSRS